MDENLLVEALKKAIENKCAFIVLADQSKNVYAQFDFTSLDENDFIWEFVSNEYLSEEFQLTEEKIILLKKKGFEPTEHNFLKTIEIEVNSTDNLSYELAKDTIKIFKDIYDISPSAVLEFEIFDCMNHDTEEVFEVKHSGIYKEKNIGILKIGKRGQVFFNDIKINEEELSKKLSELKSKKQSIACFREALMYKPSKDVESILNKVKASGVKVLSEEETPPEWGEIDAFSLYLAPDKFRFAVLRGDVFAFAYIPKGSKELVIYHKEVPDTDIILQKVASLISADSIIESGQSDPDFAFVEEKESEPSLHLTILFSEGKDWSTWYPEKDIAGNFKSLIKDCEKIGIDRIAEDEKEDI
ncbi:MAG: hypothetical protein JW891_07160 [Candidatus Lokiarchaeota archaeon]|nr:hypothetical protein [Candidatus Lokiarchaeota archaeon]